MWMKHRHGQHLHSTVPTYSNPVFQSTRLLCFCVRKSAGLACCCRRPPSGFPSISGVASCLISCCCCTKTEEVPMYSGIRDGTVLQADIETSGRLTGTHVVLLEGHWWCKIGRIGMSSERNSSGYFPYTSIYHFPNSTHLILFCVGFLRHLYLRLEERQRDAGSDMLASKQSRIFWASSVCTFFCQASKTVLLGLRTST